MIQKICPEHKEVENTPFSKHLCTVRGDSLSVACTTQILHQRLIWLR
jgi:hypothetical protein